MIPLAFSAVFVAFYAFLLVFVLFKVFSLKCLTIYIYIYIYNDMCNFTSGVSLHIFYLSGG